MDFSFPACLTPKANSPECLTFDPLGIEDTDISSSDDGTDFSPQVMADFSFDHVPAIFIDSSFLYRRSSFSDGQQKKVELCEIDYP